MGIMMIGIDHSSATIQERERFSFTRAETVEALKNLKGYENIEGSLLISTCNRTELWISGKGNIEMSMALQRIAPISSAHLVVRKGPDAVTHLFRLSCGLESMLLGEDQILTQIKEALDLARKSGTSDSTLEQVFGSAVAAAKKVKSQVRISAIPPSAAGSSMMMMEKIFGDLTGLPCLIIGNGQIGKMLAGKLAERGAKVTMTLRKKMHGKQEQESITPEGCLMVDYEKRWEELRAHKCIISATLSPHCTLRKVDVQKILNGEPKVMLDLAMPRDIEESVGTLPGVKLYNIDEISRGRQTGSGEPSAETVKEAEIILTESIEELLSRLAFEKHREKINSVAKMVSQDVLGRMKAQPVNEATEKAVGKMLFGLRKHLNPEMWGRCIDALEAAADADTLKTGQTHENNGEQKVR